MQTIFTRRATLWRAGVVVGGLVLAYGAFASALVAVTHNSNPRLALGFQPADPVASNALAARLVSVQESPSEDVVVRVDALARRSLRMQAINGPAVQMLLMVAAQNGDRPATVALARVADRLSRRDIGVQFFLIEDAIARDDIGGIFDHYDTALRVSPGSQGVLFPVLTTALEDRRLWSGFTPYLRKPSPWFGSFFTHAVRNTSKPEAYAAMIVHAGGLPATPELNSRQGDLLRRLVEARRIGWVAALYPKLPGASPSAMSSIAFTPETTVGDYGPVTWSVANIDGVSQSFVTGDEQELELNGIYDPSTERQVAWKLFYPTPGIYRFRARERMIEGGVPTKLRWWFECVRPRGNTSLWLGAYMDIGSEHVTSGMVAVPANCPAVMVKIAIKAAPGSVPSELRIDRVSLTRRD